MHGQRTRRWPAPFGTDWPKAARVQVLPQLIAADTGVKHAVGIGGVKSAVL